MMNLSGTETCRLNQSDLIAAGREFTPLIALNDHTTTRLNPNHSGPNPAKGG